MQRAWRVLHKWPDRGLIRAAQPAAAEGSEGGPKRSAGPRMHERVVHASGAKRNRERTKMHERDQKKKGRNIAPLLHYSKSAQE
jgi:hypothetical protein